MNALHVNKAHSDGSTLIQQLGGSGEEISKSHLLIALLRCGVREQSPLFAPVKRMLALLPDPLTDADLQTLKANHLFLSRALDGELVFPDFAKFIATLDKVYDIVEPYDGGEVASYIPQLAAVDPDQFGAACCSIDAQQWARGDCDAYFCIQSVSKAITYGLILEEHGAGKVHQHIGREPSGSGFNERVLNADGLPHNPCINSGAIMAASLVKPSLHISARFDHVMDTWSRICGGAKPTFNNATFLSERDSADRNFCLAYMMREEGVFPDGTDLVQTLELYFMLCSIEVSCDMLAIAAATLASGGVCPLTGDRVFTEQTVRNILSIVASCGMYDASGQFIFDIGFPAKSGVGGGLLIVIPGKCGLATFSPRLEGHGNSARGVRFCEQLATRCDFHQYSIRGAQAQHSLSTLADKAQVELESLAEREAAGGASQKPAKVVRRKSSKSFRRGSKLARSGSTSTHASPRRMDSPSIEQSQLRDADGDDKVAASTPSKMTRSMSNNAIDDMADTPALERPRDGQSGSSSAAARSDAGTQSEDTGRRRGSTSTLLDNTDVHERIGRSRTQDSERQQQMFDARSAMRRSMMDESPERVQIDLRPDPSKSYMTPKPKGHPSTTTAVSPGTSPGRELTVPSERKEKRRVNSIDVRALSYAKLDEELAQIQTRKKVTIDAALGEPESGTDARSRSVNVPPVVPTTPELLEREISESARLIQAEQNTFMEQLNNELLYAVWRREFDVVRVCLARGADLNYADYDQRTALHVAASEGDPRIVSYLLAHGSDKEAVDRYNNTALDDARREGHNECVELLTKKHEYAEEYFANAMLPDPGYDNHELRAARLFGALDDDASGKVSAKTIERMLQRVGYHETDSARLRPLFRQLKPPDKLFSKAQFSRLVKKYPLVQTAVENTVSLVNYQSFRGHVEKLYEALLDEQGGQLGPIETYEHYDPDAFAVACCSTTGQQLLLGDYDTPWCVDSCGKVITYLIALDLLGAETVHKYVGKEPSGRNFNDLALDKNKRPHNPVINAGAIMIASLILPDEPMSRRFAYIKSVWQKLTGGTEVGFDNETFLARLDKGMRCYTLAYMMLDTEAFPPHVTRGTSLQNMLELFFMTTSLTATAQQMAVVSATLANGGVNPLTNERVFRRSHVRNSLSIMAACGMYDYSGEFIFNVGVPAKSGGAGGIMAVAPKILGCCTWSPRIDSQGNSVRGVQFFEGLTERYNFHVYDILVRNKEDPTMHNGSNRDDQVADLLFAAAQGDVITVRKVLSLGLDADAHDYDRRTALHVGAAEGHVAIVKLLLDHGADPGVKDRWNISPLEEARQNKSHEMVKLLDNATADDDYTNIC